MRRYRILLLLLVLPFATRLGRYLAVYTSAAHSVWAAYQLPDADATFREATTVLEGLHTRSGTPQPGDWRHSQIEPEQTFAQFVLSDPTRVTAERHIIYLQPLGTFSESQQKIVELSADFLGRYFCTAVEVLPEIPDSAIPAEARRIHPHTGQLQFLSSWIHGVYLKPRLPDDAAVLLALTATDLWPGHDWNFVFGEASLEDRVGIWSIARFGDPQTDDQAFQTCLRRTLKVATHETGHMFSMHHCVSYECNMAAGSTLEECDKFPVSLCPVCVAKLHWTLQTNPAQRFRRLADFCRDHGLSDERLYYERAEALISQTTTLPRLSLNEALK